MPENKNIASVYAQSLIPRQRKSILGAYVDFITTLTNYENVIYTRKLYQLAGKELVKSFCNYPKFPWKVEEASEEDIEQYNNFINLKLQCDESYGFSSIKETGSKYDEKKLGIISAPKNYKFHSNIMPLPCRVEQYVVAYPSSQKLKDIKFIVDGKYKVTHLFATDDMMASEIFDNPQEEKSFYATLDLISQFPKDLQNLDRSKMREIQIETLASLNVAIFENVVLTTLGSVAEEYNIALRDLCGKKRDDYFYQAERKGIIPSAAKFQDYLNIRNLMHHQKSSIDGLSCFDAEDEHEQNKSMRKRYMSSYQTICEKRLADRVDAYQAIVKDFSKLAEEVNPNLFIRPLNESNSKFINRIKEYARLNPEEKIYVQTNYRTKKDKVESIAKTLGKVAPNAKIIDRPSEDNDDFMQLVRNFLYRKRYLDIFYDVEHSLVRYCLLSGKNFVPTSAWQYIKNKKIINPEEAKKWTEYKKLRNDLSHKYLDENLIGQMIAVQDEFYDAAYEIAMRITKIMPETHYIGDNVYKVIHPNGKTVTIDFSKKKVIDVIAASGKSLLKDTDKKNNSHATYVEEYANGVGFTLSGTEIKGIRINGINIDFSKRRIQNSDNVRIYFGGKNCNYVVGKSSVKIITDKGFNVSNLIRQKKSQSVEKNEVIMLNGTHKISIGKTGQLEKYIWTDDKKGNQVIKFSVNKGKTVLSFSDGTVWTFDEKQNAISHNGMVLTYKNREKFAESYNNDFQGLPPNTNGNDGR